MNHVVLLNLEGPLANLLKRKLEQEGFIVSLASSAELPIIGVDLVIAESLVSQDWSHGTPVILLGHPGTGSEFTHIDLPFRPSDLLDLARASLSAA